MKFKVTFKDPDALLEAINNAVDELKTEGLSEKELEAVKEPRKEAIRNICGRWFEYDEYLTVEIDTKAETCTVVPCEE